MDDRPLYHNKEIDKWFNRYIKIAQDCEQLRTQLHAANERIEVQNKIIDIASEYVRTSWHEPGCQDFEDTSRSFSENCTCCYGPFVIALDELDELEKETP